MANFQLSSIFSGKFRDRPPATRKALMDLAELISEKQTEIAALSPVRFNWFERLILRFFRKTG